VPRLDAKETLIPFALLLKAEDDLFTTPLNPNQKDTEKDFLAEKPFIKAEKLTERIKALMEAKPDEVDLCCFRRVGNDVYIFGVSTDPDFPLPLTDEARRRTIERVLAELPGTVVHTTERINHI
jgi:hypothetical protein